MSANVHQFCIVYPSFYIPIMYINELYYRHTGQYRRFVCGIGILALPYIGRQVGQWRLLLIGYVIYILISIIYMANKPKSF